MVLLHGFPTSSRMFRNLIPQLSDRYRVIAPDYPAFGQSAMPARKDFPYTFAKFADLMDGLLTQLGATRYALYVMDYGAPVGYRLALKHPERVSALIVQNGNAYDGRPAGLLDADQGLLGRAGQRTATRCARASRRESTKFQYVDGVRDVSRIDPDSWVHDQALLDRPGNDEIQLDLFKDYATNVALYPKFQDFFRTRKPPTLIVWGKNDKIFPAEGAHPYLRDLPDAELHLLDSGHFALEDKGDEIARQDARFSRPQAEVELTDRTQMSDRPTTAGHAAAAGSITASCSLQETRAMRSGRASRPSPAFDNRPSGPSAWPSAPSCRPRSLSTFL